MEDKNCPKKKNILARPGPHLAMILNFDVMYKIPDSCNSVLNVIFAYNYDHKPICRTSLISKRLHKCSKFPSSNVRRLRNWGQTSLSTHIYSYQQNYHWER